MTSLVVAHREDVLLQVHAIDRRPDAAREPGRLLLGVVGERAEEGGVVGAGLGAQRAEAGDEPAFDVGFVGVEIHGEVDVVLREREAFEHEHVGPADHLGLALDDVVGRVRVHRGVRFGRARPHVEEEPGQRVVVERLGKPLAGGEAACVEDAVREEEAVGAHDRHARADAARRRGRRRPRSCPLRRCRSPRRRTAPCPRPARPPTSRAGRRSRPGRADGSRRGRRRSVPRRWHAGAPPTRSVELLVPGHPITLGEVSAGARRAGRRNGIEHAGPKMQWSRARRAGRRNGIEHAAWWSPHAGR